MKTLIIIKPDGTRNNLIGEITRRFERTGFKVIGLKIIKIGKDSAEELYSIHKGKPFYEDLISYITSGSIVPIVLKIDGLNDEDGIRLVRKIVGKTNPVEAEMGSIRGDFAIDISENIIHASDSPESAKREIKIFFKEGDLVE